MAVALVTPVAGALSDKISRTTHMITLGALLLVSIFPVFLVLSLRPAPFYIVLGVLWLGILKGAYFGPLAALMSELFPPATRATGLGLSYNVGVTLFGGMGPASMTWLGSFAVIGELAPGYYLSVVALVSLWALFAIRRTAADSFGA